MLFIDIVRLDNRFSRYTEPIRSNLYVCRTIYHIILKCYLVNSHCRPVITYLHVWPQRNGI